MAITTSDSLSDTGLTVMSLPDIVTTLETGMQTIYGSDINVDSNSPDGQMLNIYAQVSVDQREVLLDIYNMFYVENAYGVNLDNFVALNGVTRGAATYSTCSVSITVNQALTLVGLSTATSTSTVYSVLDAAGNIWQLATTYSFGSAGTAALAFQCTTPGVVQAAIGAITQQNTAVLGVTAVNNAVAAVPGADEETDQALKVRRASMFKLPALGPSAAIQAALLAMNTYTGTSAKYNITDAMVWENNTNALAGVIPANSIYIVVNCATGNEVAVGKTIFAKKTPGTGMYGSVLQWVMSTSPDNGPNGVVSIMQWDYAVAQPLYIKFTVLAKKSGETFDNTAMAAALAAALIYRLGQNPSIGDVVTALSAYNSDIIPTSIQVSVNGSSWGQTVTPTLQLNYFTVSPSNITIS